MKIVQEYYHYIDGGRLDWLHPSHGPWPDLVVGVLDPEHHGDNYLVAVWKTNTESYVAMVDGPERHHSVAQTYRWHNTGNAAYFVCCVSQDRDETLNTTGCSARQQIVIASCRLFKSRSS